MSFFMLSCVEVITMGDSRSNIGKMLKQRRLMIPLTLQELAQASGVSSSHLGRIERGERYPSARILRQVARPLNLTESELFLQAGFLSPITPGNDSEESKKVGQLDPYVASVLAKESEEVQHTVVAILTIMKGLARGVDGKC